MSRFSKRSFELTPNKRALLELMLKKEGVSTATAQKITCRRDNSPIPLSFAQQRLWFLSQLEPDNSSYNDRIAIHLTGKLNVVELRRSIAEIVNRHETLRTTFVIVDGQPVQIIATSLTLPLPVIDISGLPEAIRKIETERLTVEQARQSFDLTRSPLLYTVLLRLDATDHLLLLIAHHIIGDDWSYGIFMRELAMLYEAFCNNRPSPLPELRIQYRDFAHWQRERLQGEVLEQQLAYWREKLSASKTL
ncbi:MAG: condensation domain-containing protein, partial [Acidobacteriota bacterium]